LVAGTGFEPATSGL